MSKGNKIDSETAEERNEVQKKESREMKTLKNKMRKYEKETEHLKREKEELKDSYLRIAAEIENLRKRLEREKEEYYKYALMEFLKELLVVLDNFERALESKDQEDNENFRKGMELIHRQYLDLLMKKGIKPIEIKDKKFDPNLHQAFITGEAEGVKEAEVSEEFQKGYSLHGRLLRPSLVKVIIPKKDK